MVDTQITVLLQQQRQHLLDLKHRWINHFASAVRFDCHVRNAVEVAHQLTGHTFPLSMVWMPVWMPTHSSQGDDDVICPGESTLPADGLLIADALEHETGPEDAKALENEQSLSVRLVWETSVGFIQLSLSTNQDHRCQCKWTWDFSIQ